MSQQNSSRCVLLLALGLGPSFAFAGLLEVTVDCSQGEDLQAVLNRIESAGVGKVHVIGTCIGAFEMSRNSSVEILGQSKATSGIQAGAGAALWARNPGHLEVHDMRLVGALGIHAEGPRRVVFVVDSEIDAGVRGISADAGAGVLLQQSTVTADDSAIAAFNSEVVVEGGTLHDSTFGAFLSRSALWLTGTTVTGNSIGVVARDWSKVGVDGGHFATNGSSHLHIEDGSQLASYNAQLGAPGDTTIFSVYAARGASVEIYHNDPLAEIWSTAVFFDDSFGSLEGATLHGSIGLNGFSRLRLDGVVQGGLVDCKSASDAWCGSMASAQTNGCSSAPAMCSPEPDKPGGASPPRRLLPRPSWMPQGDPSQLPEHSINRR